MDIKEVHDSIYFALNKEQYGHISHEKIDAALHEAQLTHFTNLYSDPRDFERGKRPTPRVAYGATQKVNDELSPFIEKEEFSSVDTVNGVLQLPEGYQHLLNLYIHVGDAARKVSVVSENDLPNLIGSFIMAPTSTKPIAIGNGKAKFQLFPEQGYNGVAYYLRVPEKPVFDYTIVDRTVTYNAAGSTDLEWLPTSQKVIIQEAISIISNNLRDQWAKQASEISTQKDG